MAVNTYMATGRQIDTTAANGDISIRCKSISAFASASFDEDFTFGKIDVDADGQAELIEDVTLRAYSHYVSRDFGTTRACPIAFQIVNRWSGRSHACEASASQRTLGEGHRDFVKP